MNIVCNFSASAWIAVLLSVAVAVQHNDCCAQRSCVQQSTRSHLSPRLLLAFPSSLITPRALLPLPCRWRPVCGSHRTWSKARRVGLASCASCWFLAVDAQQIDVVVRQSSARTGRRQEGREWHVIRMDDARFWSSCGRSLRCCHIDYFFVALQEAAVVQLREFVQNLSSRRLCSHYLAVFSSSNCR